MTSSQFRRPWVKYQAGFLFVLPALAIYALFMVYPFVQSVYLSLTSWDGAQPVKEFVGLANYATLLQDRLLWLSLSHNVIWVILGTAAPLVIGLLLAILLWNRPRGFTLFRTFYFLPQVLSSVIIAIVWGWIYNPIFGLLNQGLEAVGLEQLQRAWLGDGEVALYAVLAAAVWAQTGFVFVIFMAGLQNVSRDLLEAAMLDGANAWSRFWNVTVPQLASVTTVITVFLLIGGFNVFDVIFVMTAGGPANATEVIATYTYTEAFTQNRVGYGAALSMVMTVLSLVAAVIFMRIREGGEE